MYGYRRTKDRGLVKIKRSKAPRRRYCASYEEASVLAQRLCDEADAKGAQSIDRFYVWAGGDCYSISPTRTRV